MSRTSWQRRAPDHTVTQNDATVVLEDILLDNRGNVADVSGAAIQYQARLPGSAALDIDKAATIVDGPSGHVRVSLAAGDTDIIGPYIEQWRVTFGGGAIERFPASKHKLLIVADTA